MRKATILVLAAATALSSVALATGASAAGQGSGRVARVARMDPAVASMLAALGADETATVVVSMRTQVDPASVRGRTRASRNEHLVRTLRTTARGAQGSLRTWLGGQAGVVSITPLWILNAVSVTATAEVIGQIALRTDVANITTDTLPIVPTAAPATPNLSAIHADTAWSSGNTGAGVVVANLDTGVDLAHPSLAARWRGGADSWFDPYGQHPTVPTDMSGHGTATMGVMVGGDESGTSIGVAPGARWIAAKIFNDSGAATTTAIHQAFQWALDPDHDPATDDAPDVVNNSWSIGTAPGCNLEFQPDVQALRAAGILPVFAAGNFGPGASTSVSPANYPESFSVGAVSNAGAPYSASSHGPSTCGGRTTVFPDVAAPGIGILTASRFGLLQTLSGTSMAAPHVAGALALLLAARPGLTPNQQADAVRAGAADLGAAGPDNSFGAGMLDVTGALSHMPPADAVPPLVTVAAPGPPAGQGGWFSAGQTPVTVTIDAADPSGIAAIACTDGAVVLTPTPAPVGNPGTATASVAIAGDGLHQITCSATDGLGNGPGSDVGSVTTATVAIDAVGPTASGVAATPDPTNTVSSNGTAVVLSGTVTDGAAGVAGAEWFDGPDPGLGGGVPMAATDGVFGSSSESVSTTIDIAALGWLGGVHVLSVRARDAAGNWGSALAAPVTVVLPNDIFSDGFESGTFAAWSGTGGTPARLSVTKGSAIGTYKMVASISGGSSGYVIDTRPRADAEYHARFSVHPNSYVTGTGTNPTGISIFRGMSSTGASLFDVQYRASTKIGSQVRLVVTRAGGTTATAWFGVTTKAWNTLQVDWTAGASVGAHLYTGGVLRATLSGLDTSGLSLEAVQLGPQGTLTKNGSMRFDAFASTRRTVL